MASRADIMLALWQNRASRPRTVDNQSRNDVEQAKLSMLTRGRLGLSKRDLVLLLSFFLVTMRMTIPSISSIATIMTSDINMDTKMSASDVASPNQHQLESASNNSSRLRREMDYTRKNNITASSSGRSAKWTADPREVVRTKPYNNKKVAYIAYGSFKKGHERFQIMIIDSLRTWLKDNVIFYVLNKEWKTKFEEVCNELNNRQECKRVVPIFVDCPEGYYGPSPCCKMDKGMAAMWEQYAHYDWYSYQDDDMYIRAEYMDDFLSGLSPDDPMVLTRMDAQQLGISWGDKRKQSNCSSDLDFRYPWGQPAIYSRAGLERMSKAFQMGAVAKQCKAFGVTHDVGNPIVHWMLRLPEVRLPPISRPPKIWAGVELGAHGVGRLNTPNLTEVYAQIGHVKHPQPPYRYRWHKPNGFLQTTTYKLHGNVSEWTEWHTMNVSDCRGPVHLLAN